MIPPLTNDTQRLLHARAPFPNGAVRRNKYAQNDVAQRHPKIGGANKAWRCVVVLRGKQCGEITPEMSLRHAASEESAFVWLRAIGGMGGERVDTACRWRARCFVM